jgi:hypothetical protein
MLVKCLQEKPNESQIEALGEYYKKYSSKHDSHLSVGKTYVVLGLMMKSHPHVGRGTWVTVLCDYGHIEGYPIVLFEVLDGRVDIEWIVHSRPDGIVEIEPELLLGAHFVEDHLDGLPEAVKPFKELLGRMEQRAGAPVPPSTLSLPRIN